MYVQILSLSRVPRFWGDFPRFAGVFDNGKLQIWDYRYIAEPFMKIVAHAKTVSREVRRVLGSDRDCCVNQDFSARKFVDGAAERSSKVLAATSSVVCGRVCVVVSSWRGRAGRGAKALIRLCAPAMLLLVVVMMVMLIVTIVIYSVLIFLP